MKYLCVIAIRKERDDVQRKVQIEIPMLQRMEGRGV